VKDSQCEKKIYEFFSSKKYLIPRYVTVTSKMCCVCVATAGLGPDSHPQFFSQKLHEAASKCASEEEEAKKNQSNSSRE